MGHQSAAQTDFRYPRSYVALLRWFIPCPIVFCSVAYFLTGRSSSASALDPYLFLLVLIGATALCALTYASVAKRRIRVTYSDIQIQELFSTRNISFTEISEVNLLQGGRGPLVLKLLDRSHRTLAAIGGSIENFESLTMLVKERAATAGAQYRYRDMRGRWTQ